MVSSVFLQAPPIYRQIVAKFEDDIYSGKLRGGERVPSTTALAKEFGVGRNAVQQALSILAERGLVERHVKRGTFVREQVRVRTLGVLFDHNIVARQYSQFLRLIYSGIVKAAADAGWRTELYFPVVEGEYSRYVSQIERDIVAGRLQAVLNFDRSDLMQECLRSAGCPSINYYMPASSDSVGGESVLYRGLDYLAERGIARVAVVCANNKDITEYASSRRAFETLRLFGVAEISERGGIEVGERIFNGKLKFDALFILNDTVCRGIVFHLMNRGIRIPKDVAVLAMTNKGHEVLCPVPLTRIEWDPELIAEINLKRLFAKISGVEQDVPPSIPRLIMGESCGERGNA